MVFLDWTKQPEWTKTPAIFYMEANTILTYINDEI